MFWDAQKAAVKTEKNPTYQTQSVQHPGKKKKAN